MNSTIRTRSISTINEDEDQVLQKFSNVVDDLNQDEETLLRFLRARERDIPKAEAMLRKCLQWRKDNDIDSYLLWEVPDFLGEEFQIKFSITGKDHGGESVFWIPIGNFLGRECIEHGHKDIMFKFTYHLLERGLQAIRESGKGQITVVLALENLSMRQLLHVETMQTLYQSFQILEQNYPEILRHLIVVNAPWMFSIAYSFVKPILSEHTISKIQIHDSNSKNWIEQLSLIMPLESIPEEYFI